MTVALYQRWSPGDRLRVWVGVFEITTAPAVGFTLDGVPVAATALRALASARPDGAGGLVPANERRAFTGVYEIAGCTPGRPYRVGVRAGGESAVRDMRTQPADLDATGEDGFSILLVSCYYAAEASGALVPAVARAAAEHDLDLALLMGDQVYLDLPTLADFRNDEAWLARKFEGDYVRNWRPGSGYDAVLGAAPTVALPDDHEYWNNAPHYSPIIGNSTTEAGRRRWQRAAEHLIQAFQEPVPNRFGAAARADLAQQGPLAVAGPGAPPRQAAPVRIDVAPVSIVCADGRSQREDRSPTQGRMFAPGFAAWLRGWVDELNQRDWHGVFVTGQSLFREPASALAGKTADWEMPNYHDFAEVAAALAQARRPLTLVTGDVHWGRALRAADSRGIADLYEVVCSPSSLVASVGVDQGKQLWNSVSSWFRRRDPDPWPRHGQAEPPPEFFAGGAAAVGRRYRTGLLHRQRGDQIAVLTLRRFAGKVRAEVAWYPVSRSSEPASRIVLFPSI